MSEPLSQDERTLRAAIDAAAEWKSKALAAQNVLEPLKGRVQALEQRALSLVDNNKVLQASLRQSEKRVDLLEQQAHQSLLEKERFRNGFAEAQSSAKAAADRAAALQQQLVLYQQAVADLKKHTARQKEALKLVQEAAAGKLASAKERLEEMRQSISQLKAELKESRQTEQSQVELYNALASRTTELEKLLESEREQKNSLRETTNESQNKQRERAEELERLTQQLESELSSSKEMNTQLAEQARAEAERSKAEQNRLSEQIIELGLSVEDYRSKLRETSKNQLDTQAHLQEWMEKAQTLSAELAEQKEQKEGKDQNQRAEELERLTQQLKSELSSSKEMNTQLAEQARVKAERSVTEQNRLGEQIIELGLTVEDYRSKLREASKNQLDTQILLQEWIEKSQALSTELAEQKSLNQRAEELVTQQLKSELSSSKEMNTQLAEQVRAEAERSGAEQSRLAEQIIELGNSVEDYRSKLKEADKKQLDTQALLQEWKEKAQALSTELADQKEQNRVNQGEEENFKPDLTKIEAKLSESNSRVQELQKKLDQTADLEKQNRDQEANQKKELEVYQSMVQRLREEVSRQSSGGNRMENLAHTQNESEGGTVDTQGQLDRLEELEARLRQSDEKTKAMADELEQAKETTHKTTARLKTMEDQYQTLKEKLREVLAERQLMADKLKARRRMVRSLKIKLHRAKKLSLTGSEEQAPEPSDEEEPDEFD